MKFDTFKAIVSTVVYLIAVIITTFIASRNTEYSVFYIAGCVALCYAVPWIIINIYFIDEIMNKITDREIEIEHRWNERARAKAEAKKGQ